MKHLFWADLGVTNLLFDSHLCLQVTESDSGKYSCRPSNTEVVSTMVYVIKGNKQRQVQP